MVAGATGSDDSEDWTPVVVLVFVSCNAIAWFVATLVAAVVVPKPPAPLNEPSPTA